MSHNNKRRWVLIVHGGAKPIEPDEEQDNRAAISSALDAAGAILAGGGSAVDAVEAAVRVMEEQPILNAGRGSTLNARGEIEMSAAMMDGRDLSVGAIAYVSTLKHPVSVAKALLPERWVLLVGSGALEFAEQKGAERCAMESLITEKNLETFREESGQEMRDTVGAVALDQAGNLAVASGTGGLSGSPTGRVSDTAMPGCGYYAQNGVGAVAFSGDGETISRLALAAQVMARIEEIGPEAAIAKAVAQVPPVGGEGADAGGIAITADGRVGWAHNSPNFAVGTITSEMTEPEIWLSKEERQRG